MSTDIEIKVLSQVMDSAHRDCMPIVASLLPEPSYFSNNTHMQIWNKMLQRYAEQESVEVDAMIDAFKAGNPNQGASSVLISVLLDLSGVRRDRKTLEDNCAILIAAKTRRDLKSKLEQGVTQCDNPQIKPDAIVDYISQELIALTKETAAAAVGPNVLLAELREQRARRVAGEILGIPCTFDFLKEFIRNFRYGTVNCLAAYPSIGKTTFVIDMAIESAMLGHPVLFVSIEMERVDVVAKMISKIAGITANVVEGADTISYDDAGLIETAEDTFARLPITICDNTMTASQICSMARRYKLQHGKLDLIIIDYLQLVVHEEQGEHASISLAMGKFMALSKELHCVIMLLSQFKKSNGKQDGAPDLNDLAGSSAIRNGCATVLTLHQVADYGDKKQVCVSVQKARFGKVGENDSVLFNAALNYFEEM